MGRVATSFLTLGGFPPLDPFVFLRRIMTTNQPTNQPTNIRLHMRRYCTTSLRTRRSKPENLFSREYLPVPRPDPWTGWCAVRIGLDRIASHCIVGRDTGISSLSGGR